MDRAGTGATDGGAPRLFERRQRPDAEITLVLVSRREALISRLRSCTADLESRVELRVADDAEAGLRLLGGCPLLLLDLASSPRLEALARCRQKAPSLAIILVADADDEAEAVRALDHGASDYLLTSEIEPRTLERILRVARRQGMLPGPRASNAQLHYLQELLPCPVLVYGIADGVVLYANPKVGPTFGITSNQLVGERLERFVYETGALDFLARAVQEHGSFDDYETQLRRNDGSIREVRLSGLALDRAGVRSILLFLYDVTPSHQAEATLRSLEISFREFFEENLSGNFRAAGNGRILACNRAFNLMFGLSAAGSSESWNLRQLHPSQESYEAFLTGLRQRGRLEHFEASLQRADGTPVEVIQNVVGKFDERSNLREIRGYLFDISEHKRTEKQLRQSQKMEAIGLLAGGIAHDFNNLLTAITGYSELVLNRLEAGSELRRDVEEIRQAGRRAATLTKQLLAFSRKQILQPEVLNLNDVVADLDRMLQRLIGEDIHLETRLQPLLGTVKADRGQIEQVIVNLLVNARDAMPHGGTIVLETSSLELTSPLHRHGAVVPAGWYVALRIRDSGVGIEPETLPRIFEPFFTTKERGRGSGLGLSTVYGIVKQSNGFIFVDSTQDVGTTFEIYLSRLATEEPKSQPADVPHRTKRGGNETILLVEDEASVRDLATLTLQMKGYRLLVATDGEQALRICEERIDEIELVVTDIVMPQMSGRQLVERARELKPELKVLFLSGYADDAIGHDDDDPNQSFMSKPFTPSSLAEKVRQVLDRLHDGR